MRRYLKGLLIVLILFISSCTYYVFPPKVKTRYETQFTYKYKSNDYELSKFKKSRKVVGYINYDKSGNAIEEGEFGEIIEFVEREKNLDSSFSYIIGHTRKYKNLNTVYYCKYDSCNKLISDELWQYKNNIKANLIYRTCYYYNENGKIIKELEYDQNSSLSRNKTYTGYENNLIITIDSVFNFINEGITRVEDKRQDTIKTDYLERPIEVIHFYKGKFLYRKEYRYNKLQNIETEIRYDDKPDSLWSITEWEYNINKQLVRKFWKVIDSKTEKKDIYLYNRKKLLVKVLHFSGDRLESYTKYKYKLY